MNHHLHPDTQYELNRLYQKERLGQSQRQRPFSQTQIAPSSLKVKDRLFLTSGELLILLGKNLKSRAARPVCKPQAV